MSKIKNTTAKRKKRVEKGLRMVLNGSNPHSKGLFFSESRTGIEAPKSLPTKTRTATKTKANKEEKSITFILNKFIPEHY